MLPLVEELPPEMDAVTAFHRLKDVPYCVFLDSALAHGELGRYSFVAAEPFFSKPADASSPYNYLPNVDPLDSLSILLAKHRAPAVAGLPPWQGGAIALLSYDLSRSLEFLASPRYDEFRLPMLTVALYSTVLAFDHRSRRGYIIAHGWSRPGEPAREEQAAADLAKIRARLRGAIETSHKVQTATLPASQLAPQYPIDRFPRLTSNFSREQYLAAVRRAVEYIHAGDIFQVNLAQRLLHPATCESAELYLRLRERNPATFAGYFDLGDYQIISASPERFLSVRERRVEARPIKGTRGRSARPEADLFAADDLRQSEKDRAENVMIVDLMRNDLAKVCDADSVRVTQLCGLEQYQYVQHLVSVIEGKLADGQQPVDLLHAAFPGGSITGAPKVRAMEIIAELEPTARGAYCGSLGYIGFDGTMDFNILIRTITAGRGWWQLPVGGGIVAQSDPEQEYEETWQKALGMLKALR